jgi:membrane protein
MTTRPRGPLLSDAIRERVAAIADHVEKWELTIRARLGGFADVFFSSLHDAIVDHIALWGAALAFYSFLSLFPMVLGCVSIASFVVDPDWAIAQAEMLVGTTLPESQALVGKVVREAIDERGTTGLVSAIMLVWAGSQVFRVLTIALNIVYGSDEPYGYFRRAFLRVGMTLSVGLFALAAVLSGFVLDALSISGTAQRGMLFASSCGLVFVAFYAVYQFVPRGQPKPKASLVGAAIATVLFVLARVVFVFWVQRFAAHSLIYGSVAITIVLLVWIWIAAVIVLYGGEVASHFQQIVLESIGAREVQRRHECREILHKVKPRGSDE